MDVTLAGWTKSTEQSGQAGNDPDGLIEDARIWTQGPSSATYRPSLSDLQVLAKTASRLDAAVNEAHAAVGDPIKTAAGGLLPATDTFVRLFAKSLVGAVARQTMASVFPRDVSDLRTAALWLDLAAAEPTGGRRFGQDRMAYEPAVA